MSHAKLDAASEYDKLPVMTPEPLELRMDISRAMAVLPPHYRVILLMRDVDGLTLNETSETLGLELAATKSRLHRARAVMRDQLSQGIHPFR